MMELITCFEKELDLAECVLCGACEVCDAATKSVCWGYDQ